MSENDFYRQQQAAVERMREMNSRAAPEGYGQQMPPVPPFVKLQNNGNGGTMPQHRRSTGGKENHGPGEKRTQNNASEQYQKENEKNEKTEEDNHNNKGFFSGLNIPFLDSLGKDSDITLIIGLLLILISEKADKKLLFALIYILL